MLPADVVCTPTNCTRGLPSAVMYGVKAVFGQLLCFKASSRNIVTGEIEDTCIINLQKHKDLPPDAGSVTHPMLEDQTLLRTNIVV
jgi:hypothetical protein